MAIQTYLSAMTSINSAKIPAVYNKIDWNKIKHFFRNQDSITVLDYGCGRYTDHIKEFCANNRINWFGYDINWNPDLKLLNNYYDVIICSNVLNVIREFEVIHNIKLFVQTHSKFYFITVYEGDKTGIGRETKPGCWQRNEETGIYLYNFEKIKKKVITNEFGNLFIK